jgi:hypothetical protein
VIRVVVEVFAEAMGGQWSAGDWAAFFAVLTCVGLLIWRFILRRREASSET